MGGETQNRQVRLLPTAGLSPRGRGNHSLELNRASYPGSIPAWAGKPGQRGALFRLSQVYPRVGGETIALPRPSRGLGGLSPRGRGNRRHRSAGAAAVGSIPAWAGKPDDAHRPAPHQQVYPRVGGETITAESHEEIAMGLSPRGRGNLVEGVEILPM